VVHSNLPSDSAVGGKGPAGWGAKKGVAAVAAKGGKGKGKDDAKTSKDKKKGKDDGQPNNNNNDAEDDAKSRASQVCVCAPSGRSSEPF